MQELLRRIDLSSSVQCGIEDIDEWPEGAVDELVAVGLFRPAGYSESVVCDGCGEGCLEPVEFVGGRDGEAVRAYIFCQGEEALGRIWVPLTRLEMWTTDCGMLADALARLLGAKPPAEECVKGRLWWLGRAQVGEATADAFLAVGACRADAGEVFGRVGRLEECARPLVLLPSDVPAGKPFGLEAQVQSLVRLLSVEEGVLRLDTELIKDALSSAGPPLSSTDLPLLLIYPTCVEYDGQPIILGPLGIKLLRVLAGAGGKPLAQGEIARELWGDDGGEYYMNEVRQHVKQVNDAVRKALPERFSGDSRLVKAKRRVGYYLDACAIRTRVVDPPE